VIRQASLDGDVVLLDVATDLPPEGRARIDATTQLRWAICSPADLPVASLPRRPWRAVTPGDATASIAELEAILGAEAARGRPTLTADQLRAAGAAVAGLGGDLDAAIRRLAMGHIDRLATRIVPRYGWDDLVLRDSQLSRIHEIVLRYRHRRRVYEEWGFASRASTGVLALFAGESGTGKTLSAEVIAGELGQDLYTVDLSQLVSKYIGETEKNLSAVFSAAEASPVVLFLDEADALLGKRSSVSDAHDRYANIEVAYLLQRLERHSGIVLMATNLLNNIDKAFARRIHVSVEFPLPDVDERLRIWQRSLPKAAPLENVRLEPLAERFEMSGGSIRNAALTAAFLAAENGTGITAALLAEAVNRELRKLGRLARVEDFTDLDGPPPSRLSPRESA
jgi:SpoVK/Ycf46/Vps4 family AAA+-type ATPase